MTRSLAQNTHAPPLDVVMPGPTPPGNAVATREASHSDQLIETFFVI